MSSPIITTPQRWFQQIAYTARRRPAAVMASATPSVKVSPSPSPKPTATMKPSPSPSPKPTVTPKASPKPSPTPIKPSPSPSPKATATPAATATPQTQAKMKWGAYVGWQDGALASFESKVGKKTDLVADFIHWGNEKDFPMQYTATVRDKGKTLIIYWEAKDYNHEDPNDVRFNYDSVNAGKWDDYFKQFAADAKTYNGPVILVPFDEMNDNVAPWSGTTNNNSPAKHIQAYRRIRDIFRPVASNVKFGWSVNSLSVPNQPGNLMEEYYPGDAYVDYVGVDGFNFGNPWQSFDQVFAPALRVLAQYKKPIYLFSMGSMEGGQKANWIKEGLGNAVYKYPNIAGWVWFNEDKATNGEHDWRIDSDANSLNAFKEVLP